jgi:cell division protein FtsX
VHDLDIRLEQLAAEATRDVVPPDPAVVARRGRRRRRRQVAGTALLVAAVVAAGLVLLARLAGPAGPAPDDPPAAATDLSGAGMLAGHWFGKTDATVYLDQDVDPARRQLVKDRIEALNVVDKVYFESRREAYDRFRALYRAKPEVLAKTDPATLPQTFRVRLGKPQQFKQLFLALCRPGKSSSAKPRCVEGVTSVVEDVAQLKPLLVGNRWSTVADVTVVLPDGTSDARRRAVQARLEAIDGVSAVTYQSPAETYRELPEKLRRDPLLVAKLRPETLPASFRVTLEDPKRVDEFHRALCGSRQTGACAGLVVLEHAGP